MTDINNPEKRIVIGQRGWVWVGDYTKIGTEVKIENAYCIRIWGTDQGLGQLCNGPVEKTVLDFAGTVRIHELAVVGTYDCDKTLWDAALLKKK
jgi:hypothetical protein